MTCAFNKLFLLTVIVDYWYYWNIWT